MNKAQDMLERLQGPAHEQEPQRSKTTAGVEQSSGAGGGSQSQGSHERSAGGTSTNTMGQHQRQRYTAQRGQPMHVDDEDERARLARFSGKWHREHMLGIYKYQ